MILSGRLKWRQQEMRLSECAPMRAIFGPSLQQDDYSQMEAAFKPYPMLVTSTQSDIQFIGPRIPAWRHVSKLGRIGLRRKKLKPLPGVRRIAYYRAPHYFIDPAHIKAHPENYVTLDELSPGVKSLHRRGWRGR